jgi:hypothetical protein
MKPVAILGIVLIVLGITALILHGVTYTKHKTLVDVGPVKATKQTQKTVPIPPVAAGAAIAGGLVLVIVGSRRSR